MRDDQNAMRLVVAGREFLGWLDSECGVGLDQQSRDFRLGITRSWPGAKDIPRKVMPGDRCELYIGQDRFATGQIDATPISYDATSLSVGIQGRSLTADLVDCSAINSPGKWSGKKIEDIARDLARPYGVSVKVAPGTDTGPPLDHQIDQGETVFESIDRMLKLRGLLSTDDAQGAVVICRAGGERAHTALVTGPDGNILTGSADLDMKDRFSEYRVKGQKAGEDDDPAEIAAQSLASVPDSGVKRTRVLVMTQQGQADASSCRDRARFEATHRLGKSYSATYSVQGWRQGNGKLWVPNQLVHVRDPIIGFDIEMLIGKVVYSLNESGTIATLTVAPKAAWELLPETPKAKGKGGKLDLPPGATLTEFK